MSLDPEIKINSENQKIKNHLVWKLSLTKQRPRLDP